MKLNKQLVLTIGLLVTFLIAVAGFLIYDAQVSRERIQKSRGRYLVAKARIEGARELAQQEARAEVAKHGKKATVEQKQRAHKIRESKRKNLKGPRRFFTNLHPGRVSRSGKPTDFPDREFTVEEREILEVADEAVSDADLETAKDLAAEALKSEDPRIRLRAVEALTEFGEAGLPEMADFLTDGHEEVANLAADRFELGVQEIEDDTERVAVAKLGLLTVEDEDKLCSLAGTLRLATDSKLVISALADVIRDGSKMQADAAKEAYQEETGEEWKGVEAADKWLQENYEPPEPEEAEEPTVHEDVDDTGDTTDEGENT